MIKGRALWMWSLLSSKPYWAACDPTGWHVPSTNWFLEKLLPRRSPEADIYIYKEESLSACLFVRYAFRHGTSKCNEIFQEISFRPGEGRRVVFDPKFTSQGGVCPPPLFNYYSKCLFRRICACDCFIVNYSRMQVNNNLNVFHWAQENFRILGYSKKKSTRVFNKTSELEFHY